MVEVVHGTLEILTTSACRQVLAGVVARPVREPQPLHESSCLLERFAASPSGVRTQPVEGNFDESEQPGVGWCVSGGC